MTRPLEGASRPRSGVEDRLRSLVGEILSHVSSLPAATVNDRRQLRELADGVFVAAETGEIEGPAQEIQQACARICAEADTRAQKLLARREAELRGIIEALGSGLQNLGQNSQHLGGQLEGHIGELVEGLRTVPPDVPADRLRNIAEEIRDTAGQIKEELDTASSEVGSVNSRLQEMERELEAAKEEAFMDPLTKLPNRRKLNEAMAALKAGTGDEPRSLIMLDIDHFKQINDTHGHLIGDAVLVKLAATLRDVISPPHLAVRYGGEEFSILLRNAELAAACATAEEVRTRVAAARWTYNQGPQATTIGVTVSLGVTQYVADDTPEAFIGRADSALYEAKETGRNRVCTA